jgi:REP element-mobilizing transposase RayT
MAIHSNVSKSGLYFITFTCYKWMKLIEITKSSDLFYKWFDILSSKGHCITGYVIMPNHFHGLVYYDGGHQKLNTIIGNAKRFIAYEIINRLSYQNERSILEQLTNAVSFTARQKGKKHEAWEETFDVKECYSEKFVMQKLNYIHANPCTPKWKLSDRPSNYLHSSAAFYINGKKAYGGLRDYRDFMARIFDDRRVPA